MPIDSHLPQADPFSLVPTFKGVWLVIKTAEISEMGTISSAQIYCIMFCLILFFWETLKELSHEIGLGHA